MNRDLVFISESVTAGHPDKLCDQISDAVVDAFLQGEPATRVVSECAVSGGVLFLATRFSAAHAPDLAEVARRVIAQVGYAEGEFNATDCTVMTSQYALSPAHYPELSVEAMSDAEIDALGASEPVTVFGYACRETPELMPLPITLAHAVARRIDATRGHDALACLTPDAKVQVGVVYQQRQPVRIHSVTLVTAQRDDSGPCPEELREALLQHVVRPVFVKTSPKLDRDTPVWVNPEGPTLGGGPVFHAGLTGRKNAIDTYGEYARHSGAALSGKDPLRVDRAGAYAARHAAKLVVAAGLAEHCEVHLSYAVGQAQPVSVRVHTYGTSELSEEQIRSRLLATCDFRPAGIVRRFALQSLPGKRGGLYERLAVYGQMGREDLAVPWEQTQEAASLR